MARKRVRLCERAPIHEIKQGPRDTMTPEQRRCKIAALLANGPGRMRAADARGLPTCASHCWQWPWMYGATRHAENLTPISGPRRTCVLARCG
jgi:hypothetical protein